MIDWSLNNHLSDPTMEDTSMKHESYRLWKEAVMVCTKVPSQNFPQGMHEYHKACKGRIPHPRPSQTWCRTEIAQRWIQKGTHKMELTVDNNECKINAVWLSAFLMWNSMFFVLTRWLLPRNSSVSIWNNTPRINVKWCSWLPKKTLKLLLWLAERILYNDV